MSQPRLVGLIATIHELQAAFLEPVLRQEGLTWSLFQLLSLLNSSPSPVHQAQIAQELGITPATLSEALDAASRKGWIERTPEPSDRRKKSIALTPKAESALAQVLAATEQCERIATVGFAASERSQLAQALRRISRQLGSVLEEKST